MSRRRELDAHRQTLGEIRDILEAMKNLALMEARKLERQHGNQRASIADLRRTAADMLAHHPLPPERPSSCEIHILFGAERGFCGGFNEGLRQLFDHLGADARCVVVGRRLYARFADDPRLEAALDGASVAEEVGVVLEGLVRTLDGLPYAPPVRLTALYHEPEVGPVSQRLLPLYLDLDPGTFPRSELPLVINLPPAQLLGEFGEHYLLATLNHIACTSLLAENRLRMQHLENAVHRLDKRLDDLERRCNSLRQEEITEEIEVLLLNMGLTEES